MATAFISYSHRDEKLKDELVTHLAALQRQGLLSVWHDRRLTPGDHLDDSISANLESADIIAMLVSADFVNSEYCYSKEMARALERHKAGEARAVSIICRACDFKGLPFADFVLLPTDARAVTLWHDRDEAWLDVVNGIRSALSARKTHAVPPAPTHAAPTAPNRSPGTRSGLRLPKRFTDLDKHDFLEASFERIWSVFEANAADLEAHNEGIAVRRVRIDAQSFAVRVFAQGKEVGGGSVFIGNGSFRRDQICFSYDPSAPRNSMNEWIGVDDADGSLKLKPGGMLNIMGGSSKEELLDPGDAAALLWNAILQQVMNKLR